MKAPGTRNWSLYNRSLIKRGDICLWFSEDLFKDWSGKRRKNPHGNQKFSNSVIQTAFVLKQLYRLPFRATSGLIKSLLRLMHVSFESPDYTTICRRGRALQINLGGKAIKNARHILVDVTGVRVFGEGEWKVLVHGRSRHRLWRKLHLAIDADTQEILAATVTESVRLDCNLLPLLINNIEGTIRQITGDAAYDKHQCYRLAYKRHAKPVFPPQKNSSIQRNRINREEALIARDEVIIRVGKGADRKDRLKEWKIENDYHRRSLIETTMSRLKFIFGDEIKTKTMKNQTTELLTRCLILNQFAEMSFLRKT